MILYLRVYFLINPENVQFTCRAYELRFCVDKALAYQ